MNSLFKVLFNCPSRYLCAIGLATIFSLRWSLPPASDCNPKQSDSKDCHHRQLSKRGYNYRPFTCYGQTTIKRSRVAQLIGYNRQFQTPQLPAAVRRTAEFGYGLFQLHSPLLLESLLFSFSPLSDMLKFSGQSSLSEVVMRKSYCANIANIKRLTLEHKLLE